MNIGGVEEFWHGVGKLNAENAETQRAAEIGMKLWKQECLTLCGDMPLRRPRSLRSKLSTGVDLLDHHHASTT